MTAWFEALRWSRPDIAAGEYWRLLTGHLVHLDTGHALLNALAAVVVWTVFRRDLPWQVWAWVAACAVLAVDLGLWFGTRLDWYVGASGVLHAFAAAGILQSLWTRALLPWLFAALGTAKLIYEKFFGAIDWGMGSTAVVTDAHLFGALAGVLVVLVWRATRRITTDDG
ncbi:MAG: rhombosortase [Sinobacteraceae bacterium]|nr:rhombosortase [Nevskiaceae bacterium]